MLVAAVLGALAYLVLLPGGEIAGAAELAEVFAHPAGTPERPLEVLEARELIDGTRVVSCAVARRERAPLDVFLLRYRGPAPVLRQLAGGGAPGDARAGGTGDDAGGGDEELERWHDDPTFELRRALRSGALEWEGEQATYVLERHYEHTGVWRDEARVNLSSESSGTKRYALLVVRWPASEQGSREELVELLTELQPRVTAEPG
jgi:hypothetical protein